MARGRAPSVTRVCEKCGTEYHPWKKNKPSKYCSRACAPAGRQPTRPDCKCEHCGVLFRPVNNFSQKYCSRKCYRDAGERFANKQGYAVVYDKEHSTWPSGQVLEHRLVMAKKLGRKLEAHETVHHINGDKLDNSPSNLQIRTGRHGKGVVHKCLDCGSHNIKSVELG